MQKRASTLTGSNILEISLQFILIIPVLLLWHPSPVLFNFFIPSNLHSQTNRTPFTPQMSLPPSQAGRGSADAADIVLALAAADTDIRTAAISGMPPVTAVVCLIDPELHGHIVILKDIRNRYLFGHPSTQ